MAKVFANDVIADDDIFCKSSSEREKTENSKNPFKNLKRTVRSLVFFWMKNEDFLDPELSRKCL